MKRYRSSREVLADIDSILGAVPPPRSAPLERVVEILIESRHYLRAAICLDSPDGRRAAVVAGSDIRSAERCTATIKIAGRALGEVSAQPEPQRPLSSEDRVLLKEVAAHIARFLTGNGKHILLKFLQAGGRPAKPARAAVGGRSRST